MAFIDVLEQFRNYLKGILDSSNERENEAETIDNIRKGINFKGSNLWVLIFAIFIASLGLNVNSTAVIIGAMLISPLMGPIMGIGLGVGINDFELIKTSFRNLAIATIFGILTSTLYFLISPLNEARSELLARPLLPLRCYCFLRRTGRHRRFKHASERKCDPRCSHRYRFDASPLYCGIRYRQW
ncbi:MAG: DUF389 domain-containing protein [Odoribacter splanchnicus]